jgi:lipid II:glycine glycyltransferase (peptidoglycan interpeptide bridge formation enzyme)
MPATSADVLASYPGKARNKIRQSINTFQLKTKTGPELLDRFYDLYVLSLRRLASPPHKKAFFERLLANFGERCVVHLVYHGQTPVAGALAFKFRDCIAPYFVGLDQSFGRMNTSNFLYYSLMVQAIDAGLSVFDLGRTRQDNTGGCDFKTNQGFQPEPLHYGYYSPDGNAAPDLRHSNPKFSLAKAVWQKLPLSCVSLAGGIVTRWIP